MIAKHAIGKVPHIVWFSGKYMYLDKTKELLTLGMIIRVFLHFFKQFLAEPKRAYSFIAISLPPIQNFWKFGPKLKLLQAKKKFKQPNPADRPILAAPKPSRAELKQPQFWSDFSEILDLRSWNTFKTVGSVWLC